MIADLPLQTIATLLGAPQEDRHQLFSWTTTILDYRHRDLAGSSDALADAGLGLRAYGDEEIADRRVTTASAPRWPAGRSPG
ncbi:MAG TPA: hypothetical protein PKA98_00600 [Acidimicrobiales bacterium]|mgnify:CR=1 FL=1|nr:hypothetical protein [Acidimicrobiales bacterium]